MGENKERTLLEQITEYSKLQKIGTDEALDDAAQIATEIREELWITGEIENEIVNLKEDIQKDIRNHAHVDGKVVKEY